MAVLTNTINITSYGYLIGPGNVGTKVGVPDSVETIIEAAVINLTKSHNPQYIDVGGTSTLTYTIQNASTNSITQGIIIEPLLLLANITYSNPQGCSVSGDTITVDLTTPLAPNSTKVVSLTINAGQNITPSNLAYTTLATGTFTLNTAVPIPIVTTATDIFQINSAPLEISKTVIPTTSPLTAGNILTYTITIINKGNVEAMIRTGALTDTWTAGGLVNVQVVSDPRFTVSAQGITNNVDIVVTPAVPLTITIIGTSALI